MSMINSHLPAVFAINQVGSGATIDWTPPAGGLILICRLRRHKKVPGTIDDDIKLESVIYLDPDLSATPVVNNCTTTSSSHEPMIRQKDPKGSVAYLLQGIQIQLSPPLATESQQSEPLLKVYVQALRDALAPGTDELLDALDVAGALLLLMMTDGPASSSHQRPCTAKRPATGTRTKGGNST